MRQFYAVDRLIDVEERDFFALLGNLVGSAYSWAKETGTLQFQGFPDVRGNTTKPFIRERAHEIEMNILQIDDNELVEALSRIQKALQRINQIDDQLVGIVAKSVNLPPPESKQDRSKIYRKINRRLRENTGPFWLIDFRDEYFTLTEETEQLILDIYSSESQIGVRITKLAAALDYPR